MDTNGHHDSFSSPRSSRNSSSNNSGNNEMAVFRSEKDAIASAITLEEFKWNLKRLLHECYPEGIFLHDIGEVYFHWFHKMVTPDAFTDAPLEQNGDANAHCSDWVPIFKQYVQLKQTFVLEAIDEDIHKVKLRPGCIKPQENKIILALTDYSNCKAYIRGKHFSETRHNDETERSVQTDTMVVDEIMMSSTRKQVEVADVAVQVELEPEPTDPPYRSSSPIQTAMDVDESISSSCSHCSDASSLEPSSAAETNDHTSCSTGSPTGSIDLAVQEDSCQHLEPDISSLKFPEPLETLDLDTYELSPTDTNAEEKETTLKIASIEFNADSNTGDAESPSDIDDNQNEDTHRICQEAANNVLVRENDNEHQLHQYQEEHTFSEEELPAAADQLPVARATPEVNGGKTISLNHVTVPAEELEAKSARGAMTSGSDTAAEAATPIIAELGEENSFASKGIAARTDEVKTKDADRVFGDLTPTILFKDIIVNTPLRRVSALEQTKQHRCTYMGCSKSFGSLKERLKHVIEVHALNGLKYKCQVEGCKKLFRSREVMLQHSAICNEYAREVANHDINEDDRQERAHNPHYRANTSCPDLQVNQEDYNDSLSDVSSASSSSSSKRRRMEFPAKCYYKNCDEIVIVKTEV